MVLVNGGRLGMNVNELFEEASRNLPSDTPSSWKMTAALFGIDVVRKITALPIDENVNNNRIDANNI